MKKTFKKALSVLLAVVMCLSVVPITQLVPTINASTSKTLEQAMAWLESVNGKTLGNGQCVYLIKEYYVFLGAPNPTGNACDYATKEPPAGWKKIKGAEPQKGDILVWTKGWENYGHVAICAGDNRFFHQNWNGKYVEVLEKSYTNGFSINKGQYFAEYWGVIRPDFCSHSYGSNYLCSKCGAVNPSKITSMSDTSYIVVTDDAKTRKGPYETCDKVKDIANSTILTVDGKITNTKNNLWYRLTDGSWIYSEHVKKYSITYTDIADGCYRLKNVATGKYLIVDSGNGSNGRNVSVWPLVTSATEETWNLVEDSLGFKIHTALSSGRVLNSYGTTVKAGNNVNIWDLIANDATQRWKFQKVSGGYVIRNVSVPSCVVSVGNGDDNVSVQTFASGDKKQIWVIEAVTGCSHSYDNGVLTTLPSCTSGGVRTYSCTKCGSSYTSTVSATGHSYDSGTVTKAATCTSKGTKTYTCVKCDATKTEAIAEKGHSYDSGKVTKAATCTETGVKTYTCTRCNVTKTETIAAKGHKEETFEGREATCTEYGWKSGLKCAVCDEVLSGNEVLYPTGHNYVEQEHKPATCNQSGSCIKVCQCGDIEYEYEEMKQHSDDNSDGFCDACRINLMSNSKVRLSLAENTDEYFIVNIMSENISDIKDFNLSLQYNSSAFDYVSSDFGDASLGGGSSYSITYSGTGYHDIEISFNESPNDEFCILLQLEFEKKNFVGDLSIELKGDFSDTLLLNSHKRVDFAGKAPTCTESGYTAGTKCETCGTILSGKQTVAATGHSYDNGKITIAATCTAAGTKTYTCTKCKATKTETVAATGHSYDSGKVTKAATCTSTGTKTFACTKCKVTKTETIAAKGHKSVSISAKNATCTESGYTAGTKCETCGAILSGKQTVAATGHSYDSGKVTKAATCTATGTKTFTCTKCKVTKTETIAAKGHKSVSIGAKNATCTENGYTAGTKCSVCNKTLSGINTVAPTGHRMVTDNHSGDEYCTVCGYRIKGEEPTTEEPTTNKPEFIPPDIDAGIALGDIDDDGKITAADARLALRTSVKLEKLDERKTYAADVDKNSSVTAADARLILRYSVGLEKW